MLAATELRAPAHTGGAGTSAGTGRTGLALLTGVLLLALALRLYGLATLPFEQDELYTLRDAIDLDGGVPGIKGRPLYYLMQHVLLYVVPVTPLALRMPAFLFGVVGVWLTWRLGRTLFGPSAGVIGALLVTLSPWHLYASQFARYWTLVYLFAAATLLLLVLAYESNQPRRYLYALAPLLLGSLTHPSFIFPMTGVALALHLFPEGRLGWRWPTRQAWGWLWLPYVGLIGAGFLALKLTNSSQSLSNWGGRGVDASLRLLPAMVQWMGPETAIAGLLGVVVLAGSTVARDRVWAGMAALGVLSCVVLMMVASFRTDVYADYGMSMLPLVYVTIGAGIQRLGDALLFQRRVLEVGAAAILAAGILPDTVSHLSDGTRFDYRPAYAYIQAEGPAERVVGWPVILQRAYAPDLDFAELRMDRNWLQQQVEENGTIWLVASYHRSGLVMDPGDVQPWIDANCRVRQRTERTRLDYRNYRVELYRCGEDAAQANVAGVEAVSRAG